MIPGFEKLVEQRIKKAQNSGAFDNLEGAGKPLKEEVRPNIPDDLRLSYKILKNADFIPPEIAIKKEIENTKKLLSSVDNQVDEKYSLLKKLNYLTMKLNLLRDSSNELNVSGNYRKKVLNTISKGFKK